MAADRLVCITSGGDWNDASMEFLLLPPGLDLDKAKKEWRVWYEEEYCPALDKKPKPKFLGFSDWLLEKGGAINGWDRLEHYHDE